MERLNDHRHVHNQCARTHGYVHMYLIFVITGWWGQRCANLHQSDVH